MPCRAGLLLCDKSSKNMGEFRFSPHTPTKRHRGGAPGPLLQREAIPTILLFVAYGSRMAGRTIENNNMALVLWFIFKIGDVVPAFAEVMGS